MAQPGEKFYYGQGVVMLAEIASNGSLGKWQKMLDVSKLEASFKEERVTHSESMSGRMYDVRDFAKKVGMELSATIHSLHAENLARYTRGTVTETAAGTVTGEVLPTGLEAGDLVPLANINVSNLVLTDSAGTPATINPSHYQLVNNGLHGTVELLSLPTSPAPTQPLKAAYSHGASRQTAFLNAAETNVALRYEGVNLAEGGAPCVLELYKVSSELLQALGLITDGNKVAGVGVKFKGLADLSKPATGPLGQFGRYVQA